MTIKPTNEYKERPVLPTPLQIINITDIRRCSRLLKLYFQMLDIMTPMPLRQFGLCLKWIDT